VRGFFRHSHPVAYKKGEITMDDIKVTLELTDSGLSVNTSEGLNLMSLLGFMEYCKTALIDSMNDEPKEGQHDC
jgi:hypothetical protein